jgi:SnoaL-like domain
MMYARLIERHTRRVYAHFNARNAEPAINRFAEDAHLIFRGRSSLAADIHGKSEIAVWLRNLMKLGLRWEIHDVVIQGPPSNTRLVTWYTVRADQPSWHAPLAYKGVQYARLVWGRVRLDDILPDTEATATYFPRDCRTGVTPSRVAGP